MWLYHRYNLSHQNIEDLLAERGIVVIHESIRLWCIKFGPAYARKLRRQHQGPGDTFLIDEVFGKRASLPSVIYQRLYTNAIDFHLKSFNTQCGFIIDLT